jgi:Ser/Thr protein kinase RdoA (MazF antagonist)
VLDEVESIAKAMKKCLPDGIPVGLCHGDIHRANASIDEDGTVTLFDFDELARGPLSYDLACYWRKCLLENQDRAVADGE